MSNEETGLGATRRTPRQGIGGSPVGSWLTIALAVVAVVAGFLILQNITDNSGSASPATGATGDSDGENEATRGSDGTLVDVSVPATDATTTTTVAERTTAGSSVLVANANSQGGTAGGMTKTLELAGYDMVDPPVNASGPNLETSIVYFDGEQASAEAVANSVAQDLGGVDVLPVSTPPPTVSGELDGAGVLVMLGDDEAGKSIEELVPEDAATDGGDAAPDPSDGDVPATAPTGDDG